MIKKSLALLVFLGLVSFGVASLRGQEPVKLKRTDDHIDVLVGGQPFTTYYFDPSVAKPYLFPLRSARGTVVTRSFPMVMNIPGEDHDEPHQRAMYFGHGDIDGYDYWGEAAFPHWSDHPISTFGRTVLRKLDSMESGPQSGALTAEFDLDAPDGKPIAGETQSFVFRGGDDTRIIDCVFTITASHGEVHMNDTKEGTFAIRLARPLDSPPGHMLNSHGAEGEKAIWGKPADWVDYSGVVAGEPVGVAVFDNPQSFRHPTTWHARHYGLLAANPFALKEFTGDPKQDGSFVIPAGESLIFCYRVFIHHGDAREAKVAEAYERYASGK